MRPQQVLSCRPSSCKCCRLSSAGPRRRVQIAPSSIGDPNQALAQPVLPSSRLGLSTRYQRRALEQHRGFVERSPKDRLGDAR